MDPEQRLTVIIEHLAVEGLVFFIRAVVGMLAPERLCVRDADRTFVDLDAVSGRSDLNSLLLTVFIFLLFCLRIFMDTFDNHIRILQFALIDRLIFLRRIGLLQEDLDRHEAAVALQNLTHPVFVGKLKAVLIEMQGDRRTDVSPAAVFHCIGRRTVTLPVYRRRTLFVAECIDLNIIRDHEHRIETQAEMSDDIVFICLIFILLKEVGCSGKCDLRDVFLHLIRCHAQTGIAEGDRLCIRIHDNMDRVLMFIRILIFTHDLQFMQLGDRVTCVRDHLSCKDIMIGIQPLLDDRQHILAVDR